MNIANRLKELRKKNNLTQEKLAQLLNVSCQAISKWECGISSPDLSMIAPLTRVLHTSADQLLGVCGEEERIRRAGLDEACANAAANPDHEENYHLAAEAVREYPGEYRYLLWLAEAEYVLAEDEDRADTGSSEFFQEMMDNSLRHHQLVIDGCEHSPLRTRAIWGMITALRFIGRTEEALWYAEVVYPETPSPTREEAIALCLEGEALLSHRKAMVKTARAHLRQAETALNVLASD